MSISLLLRQSAGLTIWDNGTLVPFPPRVESLLEGISPLIKSQVPDFVNADHPNFVAFLEAYYEWMEQSGNATERTLLLNDYYDIETSIDEFTASFEDTFMQEFPVDFETDESGNKVNRKNILKRIKDFYAVKGSEKSFEFFFNAFYSSVLEVYYPRKDLFESSGGNWSEKKSIRITSNNGDDLFKLKSQTINQMNINKTSFIGSARVDEVLQYKEGPYKVTELFLSDIQGEFIASQDIRGELTTGSSVDETVFGVNTKFVMTSLGVNYRIGDKITVLNTDSGVGASGQVSRVDELGRIQQVIILNPGTNYTQNSTFSIQTASGDGTAFGTATVGAVAEYEGIYLDDGGKPSSRKKLHDSDYYQRFSYVLKSELSIEKYGKALKSLLHPAGFKFFGDILLTDDIKSDMPFHSELQSIEISRIGNYTPYTFGTTQDLRSNNSIAGTRVDLYPNGFAPGFTGVTSNGQIGVTLVYGSTIATVPEGGVTQHFVGIGGTGPLGSTGEAGGYTAAQGISLTFFPIHHHPNARGASSGDNSISYGTSFGAINHRSFFNLPVGSHFHSNPTYSTWSVPKFPYLGTGGTLSDQYYSAPFGLTVSPN